MFQLLLFICRLWLVSLGCGLSLEGCSEPTTKPSGQLWFHLVQGRGALLLCSCCRCYCGHLTFSMSWLLLELSPRPWQRTLGDVGYLSGSNLDSAAGLGAQGRQMMLLYYSVQSQIATGLTVFLFVLLKHVANFIILRGKVCWCLQALVCFVCVLSGFLQQAIAVKLNAFHKQCLTSVICAGLFFSVST